MKSYIFSASDRPSMAISASLDALMENDEECYAVILEGDDELKILMSLLGVNDLVERPLSHEDFSVLFDYSQEHLPQLSKQDFDAFYEEWLQQSGRESNMDEYGQLIFLQGRAADWNKKSNRFVLCERA